ncbi:MAG: SDR family oxidoreductase [Chloroflexi bacterium]|nr:SDR family oxidoreductase [Chloroflexota bacterium]
MGEREQQTVLITGASRGFGKEAARLLASRGHRVIATMRNLEMLDEVRAGLEGQIEGLRLDVTDAKSVAAAVGQALARHGAIDAVVNNAGYGLFGPVEDVSEDEVSRQFNTNVFGTWRVCKALLPAMRERREGLIINVSSTGGRIAGPLMGMYSATKYAIEALTEALRYELIPYGIRVVCLEPGMYKSDWQTASLDVAEAVRAGRSAYAQRVEAQLTAFRARAQTRPGSFAVAAAIVEIVEHPKPPLRWPVGEDAMEILPLRLRSSDAEWEARMTQGPYFQVKE